MSLIGAKKSKQVFLNSPITIIHTKNKIKLVVELSLDKDKAKQLCRET